MKKIFIRIAIVLVVLVVIAVVALFMFLDAGVKKGIEAAGPMVTKVPVSVSGVALSPFSGSGSVKGFVIGNPEGFKTPNAISVGKTEVSLSPGSLLSDKIIVKSIIIEAPEITYETDLKTSNLSRIQANVEAFTGPDKEPAKETPTRKLQVDEFIVRGGKITVSVTALAGQSVVVPLPELRLTDLGKGPEGITAAELTKLVLQPIIKEAIASGGKAATDLGKQAINMGKDLGSNTVNSVKDATKGITDIFKKQEKK